MGLIDCASGNSIWRGYDYFKEKKVSKLVPIGDGIYEATVSGSDKEPYHVLLDIPHPRRSNCNCPHADGKRIICKHIVAVYFTVHPEEAERLYREAMEYDAEEEKRQVRKDLPCFLLFTVFYFLLCFSFLYRRRRARQSA